MTVIPYRKLLARMALMGLKKNEAAQLLGVHYSTLMNKLTCVTAFTLDEAIALRDALGFTCPVEDAFAKTDLPCVRAPADGGEARA